MKGARSSFRAKKEEPPGPSVRRLIGQTGPSTRSTCGYPPPPPGTSATSGNPTA
ncbi:unnamed protein product, partial [Cyprideis torosa]